MRIDSLTAQIRRLSFKDKLGQDCIVQQSLNKKDLSIHFGIIDEDGNNTSVVLTKNQLEELLPFLLQFVTEGVLIKGIEHFRNG